MPFSQCTYLQHQCSKPSSILAFASLRSLLHRYGRQCQRTSACATSRSCSRVLPLTYPFPPTPYVQALSWLRGHMGTTWKQQDLANGRHSACNRGPRWYQLGRCCLCQGQVIGMWKPCAQRSHTNRCLVNCNCPLIAHNGLTQRTEANWLAATTLQQAGTCLHRRYAAPCDAQLDWCSTLTHHARGHTHSYALHSVSMCLVLRLRSTDPVFHSPNPRRQVPAGLAPVTACTGSAAQGDGAAALCCNGRVNGLSHTIWRRRTCLLIGLQKHGS